jgi:RNA polymerase sigma factor (sigma-70 family)
MFQCDCPPDDCAGKVKQYLAGDGRAGNDLARKFAALVQSIVQRVLGPGHRADWEDACQAVQLHLFSNLGKWQQRCPFCKWLAVVAARRAIDLGRLSQTLPRLPTDDIADPRTQPPDPETIELIEKIVGRFPAPWRRLWEWWIQGLPREEMARRAGKSLRTIQYWLSEMLEQVRAGLGE